jgi:Uma2 family endonuclease
MKQPETVSDTEDEELFAPPPDVSHLITEDDTPVDNLFSEKQMRLLTESLHSSWNPGFPFVVMANVAVYVALNRPAIVPDVLLTTQVEPLPEILEKDHRSYFSWLYEGRPPEVVIEIVSNKKGNELGSKMRNYEHMGVLWYAVYDPMLLLSEEPLQLFTLISPRKYQKTAPDTFLGDAGLGLTVWEGAFEGSPCHWLRWRTPDGKLVPTGKERGDHEAARATAEATRASAEAARASAEAARASAEAIRATAASARAEKLAAKLRELGLDPDSIS